MGRPKLDPARAVARGAAKKHPERYVGAVGAVGAGGADGGGKTAAVRDYRKIVFGYIDDVLAGRIPTGRYTRLAVERQRRDWAHEREPDFPYRFDWARAEKVLRFIEALPHVKGRWAARRELLVLQAWQCFIVAVIFGWVTERDGFRRFSEAYASVARKNGKSPLAAAIGLYMLVDDGEFGAEVYAGATSEKQAHEVFTPARLMVQKSPRLQQQYGLEVWSKSIVKPEDNSRFWPVIGKPGDGPAPSCAIADEFHEHLSSEQVDTMQTGMIGRQQPLMLIITTRGTNLASPCYDKDAEARKILDGVQENEKFFAIIYSIDEPTQDSPGDDWADPRVLIKANPNIGVSADREFLEAQQRQATLNPTYQNRFKTKHANVWCNASVAGINMHLWKLAADPQLSINEFKGQPALFALDLASKLDVCAFVQVFVKILNGLRHYYVFGRYYLPEDTIHKDVVASDRANQDAYRKWVVQGFLNSTDGAELDFDQVKDDLLALKSVVQVKEVIYDAWRATQLAHQLTASGATCVEFPQGAQNMAAGFDELNAALAAGRFHHDGNPVLAWMAANTIAKSIIKGLTVPSKDKPANKIDGIVAVCMGLSRAIAGAEEQRFQLFTL
jgi:phage terminase large subunit-like protein